MKNLIIALASFVITLHTDAGQRMLLIALSLMFGLDECVPLN